ncbi:2-oxo acid dehydrogenase subunit E2 [Dehalococcoidia bacterium]|nr:2-oxo acid dehydrogenase subunit E2 [Dehalococcoidia bacterium]
MATPIVMPRLGDFMTEGIVVRLAKSSGDSVDQGEVIAEIESEKLNYNLEAAAAGLFHPVVAEGDSVDVDGLIGYLLADGEAAPEDPPPTAGATQASGPIAPAATKKPQGLPAGDVIVPSSPGARRLANSLDVDLAQVTPTGPRGRIVESDVREFAEAAAPPYPPGLPKPFKTARLGGMRKSIARHMRDSLQQTAQLSYHLELDVTESQRLRREASKEHSVTVSLVDVLIKACAESLKRVPTLNSVLVGDEIQYFDQVNMGIAVALDEGLIVPVIRNVGEMDIFAISTAVRDLADKSREEKLSPDDVVGGTFTISVLGSVDGFTPILNASQSAILGVGRSVHKPVVKGVDIVVREMLIVSLTADHQVIDGAVAASFMRRLQAMVERPVLLFKHR